jgi:AcrR family transcriptional regulator
MTAVADLPIAPDGGPAERADAARNRAKILTAATELIAERGIDRVSMDDVARRACVGKGTVYRRFGDRASLALALLDENAMELQESLLRGPPPLGPGAPAEERLLAFLHALVDLLEERGEIVRASERSSPGARLRTAAYAGWHLHLSVLLRELQPEADAAALAHVLLAPLAADTWLALRREGGLERGALTALVAEQWAAAARARSAPAAVP